MQEIRNSCFGSKNVARPFFRRKQVSTTYVAVTFRHSCLPVFAWRRVVLRFIDPKQLLRISCILWCYYPKCYSIILVFINFDLKAAKMLTLKFFLQINLLQKLCINHSIFYENSDSMKKNSHFQPTSFIIFSI